MADLDRIAEERRLAEIPDAPFFTSEELRELAAADAALRLAELHPDGADPGALANDLVAGFTGSDAAAAARAARVVACDLVAVEREDRPRRWNQWSALVESLAAGAGADPAEASLEFYAATGAAGRALVAERRATHKKEATHD